MDAAIEPLLRISDKATLITAANVRADGDLTLIFTARDDARAVHDLNLGELGERHPPALPRRDENIADSGNAGSRFRNVPHRNIEATFALKHSSRRPASDRHLDNVLN